MYKHVRSLENACHTWGKAKSNNLLHKWQTHLLTHINKLPHRTAQQVSAHRTGIATGFSQVCSRQGAIQIHVYLYLYLYNNCVERTGDSERTWESIDWRRRSPSSDSDRPSVERRATATHRWWPPSRIPRSRPAGFHRPFSDHRLRHHRYIIIKIHHHHYYHAIDFCIYLC